MRPTPARWRSLCVYRTGQRFGANYLADVLRGRTIDRIRNLGHDQIPTFGVGAELGAKQWSSVFRQLVAQGLLSVDLDGYGSLRLTEASWAVLRGNQKVRLRKDLRAASAATAGRTGEHLPAVDLSVRKGSLWEALRALRLELASAQKVPAFAIFHDSTLQEMALRRPRSLAEFATLRGVGDARLERYGEQFLAVLRRESE